MGYTDKVLHSADPPACFYNNSAVAGHALTILLSSHSLAELAPPSVDTATEGTIRGRKVEIMHSASVPTMCTYYLDVRGINHVTVQSKRDNREDACAQAKDVAELIEPYLP